MSTSCIFGLYDVDTKDIILLEKTHDGFKDEVERHIKEIENKDFWDIEEIANYMVKEHDYDVAIYSHKFPRYAYIYVSQRGEKYKLLEIDINPKIIRITDCIDNIKKVLQDNKIAVIGKIE